MENITKTLYNNFTMSGKLCIILVQPSQKIVAELKISPRRITRMITDT